MNQLHFGTENSSRMTKMALKEIVSQNRSPSTRRNSCRKSRDNKSLIEVQRLRLNEAISFLERRVQKQDVEIRILSEQLSRQISLKEDILCMLNEEKGKTHKASQMLTNANKTIGDLKRKISKMEKEQSDLALSHEDHDAKLFKYREIVRKKDELLTRNQQKVDQMVGTERKLIAVEGQFRLVMQNQMKLKAKSATLEKELQCVKQSEGQLIGKLKEREEALFLETEKNSRLGKEYDELSQMYNQVNEESKSIELQMKELLSLQMQEIRKLQQQNLTARRTPPLQPQLQITVYKKEIKRCLTVLVKDEHLRRKVEKEVLLIVEQMQESFTNILAEVVVE